MGHPHLILRVIERLKRSGPLTLDEIGERMGGNRSHRSTFARDWVAGGWLVLRDDGRYEPGPKALSGDHQKRSAGHKDETGIEGSDQWLLMQQLAHQQLSVPEICELLDCRRTKAMSAIYALRSSGLIRHAGNGLWEIAGKHLA